MASNPPHSPNPGLKVARLRTWCLRCLLIVLGPIAFLGSLEVALQVSGYGTSPRLFIPDSLPGFYRTNPDFTAAFFPPQFDLRPLNFRLRRHKEPGRTRIFVLGESAARGVPEPGFGMAPLLRAQLRACYPGKPCDVYNLGIVAINSHVVRQMAEEAARFEPDLFVVYMGNNEVVGPYGPGSAHRATLLPPALIRASVWARQMRTGQLMGSLVGRIFGTAERPQWNGMSTFTDKTVRGSDSRLGAVYANFRSNLREIVDIAHRSGIRTVVATVVGNLEDCPPFASLHRPGITAREQTQWTAAYGTGLRQWELGNFARSIEPLETAIAADPEYADAHFLLGSARAHAGDLPGARRQFLAALHWDGLRFRADTEINGIIRDVVAESKGAATLADAARELGSDPDSTGPLSGRSILWEHVHFNLEGNERLARLLAEKTAGILFAGEPRASAGLGADGFAAAVGYTPFGRLRALRALRPIVGKPPFTNQLTFAEDQVRYNQEMAKATADADSGEPQARLQIENALLRDPENAELILRLAEVEFESGHPDQALTSIERVSDLEPPSPELQVRRAQTLAALNRYPEAQGALLDALRLGPNHLPAFSELVQILRRTGDFNRGRTELERAISRNPGSDYLRLTLADLMFFHGDRNEAVLQCEAVLARTPESSDALGRLASLYTQEGHEDEAFLLRAGVQGAQPFNFENHLALARIYEKRHDDEKTAACLRLASISGPAEPAIHIYLARRLLKRDRPDEALVEFARARRIALLEGNSELAGKISAMAASSASP